MWPILYRFLFFPLLIFLAHLIALKDEKVRMTIQGRRGLWKRLDEALKGRNQEKPLVWFHVSSAGELLQAEPVLEKFLNEGVQCAVTFTSVSAEKWIKKRTIQAKTKPLILDYIPYDFAYSMKTWIQKVNPSALIFVKFDLWPNAIWEASKAKIPIYLISATLQHKSKRLTSKLGRSFFGELYSHIDAIFTVTEEDKERFFLTRPDLKRIEVLGDTRFDSVMNQRERVKPIELGPIFAGKKVLILGSSWPPDEAAMFPGMIKALQRDEQLSVVICPHEPTEEHLQSSESAFAAFNPLRLSQVDLLGTAQPRVILVDSIGVLSSLYRFGDIAFIGGAFTTGVHNTMEPSAFGLPVSFGPVHYNSPEALHLVAEGLAFPFDNAEGFEQFLMDYLENPKKFKIYGENSKNFVESQCGAAEKCYQVIKEEIHANEI